MVLNLTRIARYPAPTRLSLFVLMLLSLWLPVAVPAYWLWGSTSATSLGITLLLYAEFVWLLWFWGRTVHRQARPLQKHGLVNTQQNWLELCQGVCLGLTSLFCLFLIEGWVGWLVWQFNAQALLKVLLEGFAVALGVGLAEELLFRGWLVDELQWNYRPQASLWLSSTFYALLHFVKPWLEVLRTLPSFPGLLLLGLTLGWTRQMHNARLGFAVGLHAGLVWGYYVIQVGNLVSYSHQVPEWVTGIDRNPLAGGMGLLVLGLIALGLYGLSKRSRPADFV